MQTMHVSYTLTNVVYQADLAVQQACGSCCDGRFTCDAFSVCRPKKDFSGGLCVPQDSKQQVICSGDVKTDEVLRCESCNKASPAAQMFEAEHQLS